MREAQVRKVKDHIRCEVVMTKGKYKLVEYVEAGKMCDGRNTRKEVR